MRDVSQEPLPEIDRVEIIDETGRAFQGHNLDNVRLSVQDEGHTLKIFIERKAQ